MLSAATRMAERAYGDLGLEGIKNWKCMSEPVARLPML